MLKPLFSWFERRLDPYLMVSGGDVLEWQAGLRYETTDVEVDADGAREEAIERFEQALANAAHAAWNCGLPNAVKDLADLVEEKNKALKSQL